MEWTSDRPAQPGFYWVQQEDWWGRSIELWEFIPGHVDPENNPDNQMCHRSVRCPGGGDRWMWDLEDDALFYGPVELPVPVLESYRKLDR